jgi:hypothetical protein
LNYLAPVFKGRSLPKREINVSGEEATGAAKIFSERRGQMFNMKERTIRLVRQSLKTLFDA